MGYYIGRMSQKRLLLVVFAILSILIVWLPFTLKLNDFWGLNFETGLMRVWANFDGPNYLIVARTWYDKALIAGGFSNPLPLEYYPAHWPFFPAVIYFFDLFLSGPRAMLISSLLGTAFFYFVLIDFLTKFGVSKKKVFILGLVSLILPARWLAVRSVGSPEAWFMGFLMLSLLSYKDKRYWMAGIFGALAQATKSPAILLFAAVGIFELIQYFQNKANFREIVSRISKMSLIPVTILLVFGLYYWRTGDFLAYFHSGDNFHLLWPPFSIFSRGGEWVGSFWLEEMVWLWVIYGVGLIRFWKKQKEINLAVVFGVIFWVTTLFVSHRDLSRYILPIMPLVLVGWEKVLAKREVLILMAIMVLPVLLFTWNFLLNNYAPVADWSPYL
jgi:hypothetical protein